MMLTHTQAAILIAVAVAMIAVQAIGVRIEAQRRAREELREMALRRLGVRERDRAA